MMEPSSRAFQYKASAEARRRSATPAFTEPTTPDMGRKALFILACCLGLSRASDNTGKGQVNTLVSASKSVSHLYRKVPVGVYAKDSPYGAFSYHAPTIITVPRNGRIIPVNEEKVVAQNTNGLLKDSYGNKFEDPTHIVSFKTMFPQQFVRLQDLPLHLSQPLVPGAPALQFKQNAPHYFAPSQFRVQGLQAPNTSPFARYAAVPHPILNDGNIRNFASSPVLQNNFNAHPVVQQQPTSNKAIFSNTQSHELYNKLKNEPKFQRLQEGPKENENPGHIHEIRENKNYNHPQPFHRQKEELQTAPAKVTTYVNGQKTVLSIDTKPPLPLLDISLLEPLTFDNPLVPQVQHFLPRINEATYHKLPNYNINVKNKQKEQVPQKHYDGEIVKGKPKPKNKVSKKKQYSPQPHNSNENDQPKPSITVKGTPNESPEFSYEINSPNYKETYKEQVVSYNKETKSEPVNYSYNKESQSEPVHYSYKKETKSEPVHYSNVHSSKAPQQEMMVYYENDGQGPKHLVYTSSSGFKNDEQSNQLNKAQPTPSSGETQNDSSEDHSPSRVPQKIEIEHEQYAEVPQSPHHLVPEHREEVSKQKVIQDDQKIVDHDFPKSFMELINAQINNGHFQPITPEYKTKAHSAHQAHSLSTHKPNENIRVNPDQHIQRKPSEESNDDDTNSPNQHIQDKPRQVIVHDETPEDIHLYNEKENADTVDREENSEEKFEEDYKNAAIGFPRYESNSEEIEKDIYNPAAYGVTREHNNFDIEHAPFQQYYEEGDKFPKQTHSNYKDSRDKLKEDYFLDFSVSKPESMTDRHQNKVEYYKMYKNHKPEVYFGSNQNADKANENRNAKYSAAPAYLFNYAPEQKQKQQFARYQTAPQIVYEYDYGKEAPRDNAAYGTQPFQRYKTKTQFVEPQFQYGFEPSTLPHLLESELATMASNNRPESEKPGSRKKLYKENWYIKKTSTSDGSPSS